jgi:hypothetical protein
VYYRRLFIDPDSRHGIGIRGRRTDGIAKSGPPSANELEK